MKVLKITVTLIVMCAGVMMNVSSTFAEDIKACVEEARSALQECTTLCKDTFLAAKDGCRDIEHPCADGCRAIREGCVGSVLSALEACKEDNCDDLFETAIDACKVAYPKDSPERHLCIDNAQVVAFQCRDTCRETVAGDLKACRTAFKKCIKDCPPAPTD